MNALGPGPAELDEALQLIQSSPLFDASWYASRYPDVGASGIDPAEHYLRIGSLLGRRPSLSFDPVIYAEQHPEAARSGVDPLLHCLKRDHRSVRPGDLVTGDAIVAARPELEEPIVEQLMPPQALKRRRLGAPTVMVCAHHAPERLYGGERSFIDVVQAFDRIGFNVVVVLPAQPGRDYVSALYRHCVQLVAVPYRWWTFGRELSEANVGALVQLMCEQQVEAVHVNTIMLAEPLVAARRRGVPGIVHVRELVRHDADLCAVIGGDADAIIERVLDMADGIVANSQITASCFQKAGRTWVVPNCADPLALDVPLANSGERLTVSLVSSNLPKKGIDDFARVAAESARRGLPLDFLLIGPINQHVERLLAEQEEPGQVRNLSAAGYMAQPAEAMQRSDIVLNLSHFQESFGRTVLEAMAARRPVVAYDWGAIGELVDPGLTGFLVSFGDIDAVVDALQQLVQDRSLLQVMGEAGRNRALQHFSPQATSRQLQKVYSELLPSRTPAIPVPDMLRSARGEQHLPRVSVVIPNYNYAGYLTERIDSIAAQTLRPIEILFLDDCSSDDSLTVAQEALERTGIPSRLLVNERNQGVYRQWQSGVAEASGDLLWIAEADDSADPLFLERLCAALAQPQVVMAFSQSRVIDAKGEAVREDMRQHTDGIDANHWLSDYVELGTREVVDYLCYRNTIPNVSACLFRRETLLREIAGLQEYRYCGDWYLYCKLLASGSLAFVAEALNSFRRHQDSVTRTRGRQLDYLAELIAIQRYIVDAFPIHPRQLDRLRQFIDRDYRIESLARNSESDGYQSFQVSAEAAVAGRRRFALVTTNNGSFNGGSEVLWVETALRLRKQGHDVVVVLKQWDPEPPFMADFRQAGIRAYFRDDGYEAVVRFAPDLLVISTGDQDEGTDWYEVCERARLPYVVVNQLTKTVAVWPLRLDRLPKVQRGYAAARRVFFTCWNNHGVMQDRLSARIENADIHFNPFHFERNPDLTFPPIEQGLRLAVPARLLKIHKGQHLILELLARGKWRNREVHVTFYGDGPDREELQQQAIDAGLGRVRFVARTPELMQIWRDNHGILMASFMEGLPIVLVGAMICARVPILTDVGGHREVVQDSECGFIANATTVEDLDDALERAWQRRFEWEAIGQRARQRILDYLPDDPVQDFVGKLMGCLSLQAQTGQQD